MQTQLCSLVCVFLQQEVVSLKAGSAVWSVHSAEASLHCHRVHGERLPAQLSQREKGEAAEGGAAEHVPGHM